ncbi:hypothetical protein D3C80_1802900 [compost metagenome]
MSGRVGMVDGVSQAIRVWVSPALLKWAQIVRTVEPHQHRIVSAVTIAQQIMPGYWISAFAIELKQAARADFSMTIRRVLQ